MTQRSSAGAEALRFLLVGGANTVLTTLLFYGLLNVLRPSAAFTATYVTGLVSASIATPRIVFRTRPRHGHGLVLMAMYAALYGVGVVIVIILSSAGAPDLLIATGTMMVSAPLAFLSARHLFGRRDPADDIT